MVNVVLMALKLKYIICVSKSISTHQTAPELVARIFTFKNIFVRGKKLALIKTQFLLFFTFNVISAVIKDDFENYFISKSKKN